MSYLIKPKNYNPLLDLKQTELGIKQIKEFFQLNLSSELRLRRVTAPLKYKFFLNYPNTSPSYHYPSGMSLFTISSTVYSSISVFVTCLICFFFRRRYTNSRKIV